MLTGELKNKVDQIWNAFWAGGIANPIEVIEQMTYLLFIRRLDEEQTLAENRANTTRRPIERRIYPEGNDPKGRPYESLRWSRFKDAAPGEMFIILLFTKTNSGGTDHVWFYDMQADGWSLDDKRQALLPEDKLGATPAVLKDSRAGEGRDSAWTVADHCKNNLPDVLARWKARDGSERERPRTAQSFCVPEADIAASGYDLSIDRYRDVVHEEVEHLAPKQILAELRRLETTIENGMVTLEEMLR